MRKKSSREREYEGYVIHKNHIFVTITIRGTEKEQPIYFSHMKGYGLRNDAGWSGILPD